MSKKKIIDVGLKIDIADQIKELEQQFDSLSSRAGSKMSKGMADQIASIKDELKTLSEQFNTLSFSKTNSAQFTNTTKNILEQVNNLSKRTSALEEGMSSLISSMSQHAGDALKEDLKGISQQMEATRESAVQTIDAINTIQKGLGNSTNISIDTNISESSLKKEQKKLESTLAKISKIENLDFGNEAYEKTTQKFTEEISELIEEYNRLEAELSQGDLPTEDYEKFSNAIVDVSTKIKALIDSVPDTAEFDKLLGSDSIKQITDRIDEMLDNLKLRIESRMDEIRKLIANVGDTAVVDTEKNRLTVPLDISTSATTLLKRAEKLIDRIQPYLNNYPLKLQFVLQSGYSSRKTNSLLSQFQKQIDGLPSEIDKSGIQELFDSITKDFNKELNIRIKANSLKDTETNIANTIKKIRTTVEKPMEIHPSVVLDEKATSKLQRELNRVSKELILNVKNIDLFGKNAKGFEELSSVVSAIDRILEKLDEVKYQMSPVWQTLVDIRNLINQISFADNIAEIKSLMDACTNFLVTIQAAYRVLDNNDLDNMFVSIQKRVESISGALRGNNLKEIKSVLASFEAYQKLGGTKSYTELGGADNVKNWLSRNASDMTQTQKSWYEMGQEAGQWYVQGLEDKIPDVEAAGKKLVAAALEAVRATQDSNSDAKETIKLGNDFGGGLSTGIKQTTNKVEKSAQSLVENALEQIANSVDGIDKATDSLNKFEIAISRLKSESGSWNINAIKEVLEGITVSGKNSKEIRNNALKELKGVIQYFSKTPIDKGVWEEQYKYCLKLIQLYEIYKNNGGTKDTLKKYLPYYNKIIKNADKMKLNLEALVSNFPGEEVSEEIKNIQNTSESMGETTQEEFKASREDAEKYLTVLSELKKEMLALSKETSGSLHKKTGIDEYYYKRKDKTADFTEEENHLKELISMYNEAVVVLRQLGYTTFNGNLLELSGSGTSLLSDSSLSKLYGMSKRNNYIAQIANAIDKYRDTGNQEILKYIQNMIKQTKFGKYGSDIRKELITNVDAELKKSAQSATESAAEEIRESANEVSQATEEVASSAQSASTEIKKTADAHKEAADAAKEQADAEKEVSNSSSVSNEKEKASSVKETTKAVKEQAKAQEDLAQIFSKIKSGTTKYAKPKANAENYSTDISKIVSNYIKYQELGGTESLNALTKSKTVLKDLTAEYEKQTSAIKENTSTVDKNATSQKNNTASSEEKQKFEKQVTDAVNESNNAEKKAVEVSKEVTEQKEKEAAALKKVAEASDGVYKSQVLNPDNGNTTITEYEDYFSTKITRISTDSKGVVNVVDNLVKDFVGLEKQIQKNDNEIARLYKDMMNVANIEGGAIDDTAWKKRIDALEKYNDALLELRKTWIADPNLAPEDYHGDVFDTERVKNQEKQWETVITSAQKKLQSFYTSLNTMAEQGKFMSGFSDEIKTYRDAVEKLSNTKIDFTDENSVNAFLTELRMLSKEISRIKSESKNAINLKADLADVASLDNSLSNFLDSNTAASKTFKDQLESLHLQLKQILETSSELSREDFSSIKSQVNAIESEVRSLHQTGNSFYTSFIKQLKSANAQFFATYFSFMDIIRYVREMVTTITEIDSALTELRKVSDASTSRLVQNFEKSADTAKDLGASISDVISATADWARMGYDVTAAEELARVTTLYKNVGDDITIDDASESLISTLQGFQLAYTDAESIIDKFNEVSNNFAISSGDIGEALQRSAAAFNSANTSLSQSIALIAGTNEIVQDADSVGSMWTTVSARIRGATSELEDLGEESDEYVESTSKLRDLVKGITGVDIMETEDEFKDIYTIVTEIGEVWDDISDINQAALLEALAGKRQANRLAATLTNIERVKEAYQTAEESAESAAREQENYEKSIQYSLDRFTASLEELIYDLINSQLIKNVVDIGTTILEFLDTLVEHLGMFGSLSIVGTLLGIVTHIKELKVLLPTIVSNAKALTNLLSKGFNLTSTAADLYELSYNMETAEEQAKLLGNTLKGLKGLGIAAGIAAVAFAAYELYDAYNSIRESAQEVFDTYKDNLSTIDDYKSELESLQKTINNSSDFDEIKEARSRVLEIQKEMMENYSLEASEVRELTNSLSDNAEAWKNLSDAQWQAAKRDFNDTGFWENIIIGFSGAENKLDYMLQQMESDLNVFGVSFGNELKSDAEAIAEAFDYVTIDSSKGITSLDIAYDGTTTDLYNRLLEISEVSSDIVSDSSELRALINDYVKSYGDMVDSYGDFYNQYVLQERILKNDDYEKYYQRMAKAYDSYAEAYSEDNEELMASSTDELIKQYQNLQESLSNDSTLSETQKESILNFFDELYPELLAKVGSWKFKLNFDVGDFSLRDRVNQALDAWDGNIDGLSDVTAQDILRITNAEDIPGIEDYKRNAYDALQEIASEYEIAWTDFVQLLVDMGVLATEETEEVVAKSKYSFNNISTAVQDMSDRILPQFDALGDAYDTIFNGDNGFTLEDVDTDMLEDIRSAFQDLDEDLDIDWSDSTDAVNDFLSVIGNVSSTEKEVQDAFNALATSYFNAAVAAEDFSDENAAVLEQMLSEMGIVNADEVVQYYNELAEAQAYATENGIDLTNITAEEIQYLANESIISDATAQRLAYLAMVKRLTSETPVSTSSDIEQLEALAKAAGQTADYLALVARAKSIALEVEKGNTGRQAELDAYISKLQNYSAPEIELDFGPSVESASSSGSDAGDAYVDAYEEELEALEAQRDAGIISEAEFLEKWKELILKYFGDIDKYGEEYAEQMAEYWEEYIDYMEDVISAIGTLLDKKIDAAEEGKDAAIAALEAEQEATEDYYQSQIDYLDDLIEALEDEKDALDDQIDAIQDQIDALQDANDERERSIALQQAQYNLQRAMNQRTKLQYVDGQLIYTTDTEDIRDARDEVEDAEFEITIAALEKQIELLEEEQDKIDKQIEAYEKQQEALQDLLDASNDYYDNLIEETEAYWDSLIDSLEAQKSKWEELVEQKEIAEAFATVQEAMEALGFTVDDVLNDTPGAFEAFRDAYLSALTDANAGNQNFLDGLNYATSGASTALSSISESAGAAAESLSSIGEVTSTVSDTASAIGDVADKTATAATNASTLASNSETLNTNLSNVNSTVDSISATDLSNATTEFNNLAEAIKKVSEALGIGESGTVGALSSAISDLNTMTLGDESTGIIGSFNSLASAVSSVTSAINGGGGGETDATEVSGTGMNADTGNETASGLAGAISSLKETADSSIGTSAEGGDGETVISDFNALEEAVQAVSDKIGMAGENGEVAEDSLMGIIQSMPEAAQEAILGDSGLKSMFDQLLESISACAEAASTLMNSITSMGSSSVLIGALSGISTKATGNVHIGNAYANGKLGIKKSENAIVGEAGQELIIDSSTGQYRLTNGPELTRLDKGDLVFNAEQTKAIIKNGKTDHGHSYAEGTGTLLPLTAEEMNMFKTMGAAITGIHADTTEMLEPIKTIAQKVTNNTTNIAPTINVTGTQFTVSGVTGDEVCHIVESQFSGIIANAYQRAMS